MVYVEDLDREFLFGGWQEKARYYSAGTWLYDLNSNRWDKVGP